MTYQGRDCPKCKHNEHVIPIAYGFPGPEMKKEASKGKIKLGGCEITPEEGFFEAMDKAQKAAGDKPFNFSFRIENPASYCKKHDLDF